MSLENELKDILNVFAKDVRDALEDTADEVAKDTIKKLKETSPKDTGRYARSWKKTEEQTLNGKRVIVHNSQGQLTHLLEFGHALVNGGRSRAIPHIGPAEKEAKDSFNKKLRDKIEK